MSKLTFPSKARRVIAVVIPHALDHAWRVALSVRSYVNQHPDLSMVAIQHVPRKWLVNVREVGAAGVIGFFSDVDTGDLAQVSVPVVNFSSNLHGIVPSVSPDNVATGSMAAGHLMQTGCTRFLYVSFQRSAFATDRYDGFRDRLLRAGHTSEWFVWEPRKEGADEALRQLLDEPVGVFTADDGCARRLSECAESWRLRIPQDITLVSCNNDLRTCTLATVPITSVDLDPERIGWEAAEMLHMMLAGRRAVDRRIPPLGVVARASSQPSAADDPPLDFALSYIREHACEAMTVNDIMEHLTISRRTLEKRFTARFGRTLHDEIRRVRLARAQQLLAETELRVVDVAAHCGYAKHSAFTEDFRKQMGIPPSAYRHQRRTPRR